MAPYNLAFLPAAAPSLPIVSNAARSNATSPLHRHIPSSMTASSKSSTKRAPRRRPQLSRAKLADSNPPTPQVRVEIEAPQPDKRIISACNLISAPLDIVWSLLSDYTHLADHIPNLLVSDLRPHPTGGIRLEQCGAQSILGFSFRASLVMDMNEVNPHSSESRAITFTLVSSNDFSQFSGEWRIVALDQLKTALYYSVSIVPKGLIPVRAIEWRIAEDVPQNMDAIRAECERRRRVLVAETRRARAAAQNEDEHQHSLQ